MAVLEKISRLLGKAKISEWGIKKPIYASFDRQWKKQSEKMKNESYFKNTKNI